MSDYDPLEDKELHDWPTILDEQTEAVYVENFTYRQDLAELRREEDLDLSYDDPGERHSQSHAAVELKKAWDLFNKKRFSGLCSVCDDCFEEIDELSVGCNCEIFDRFVGRRWLCIPCLLVEGTEAYDIEHCKARANKGKVSWSLRVIPGAPSDLNIANLLLVRKIYRCRWRDCSLRLLQAPRIQQLLDVVRAKAGQRLQRRDFLMQALERMAGVMVSKTGNASTSWMKPWLWTMAQMIKMEDNGESASASSITQRTRPTVP